MSSDGITINEICSNSAQPLFPPPSVTHTEELKEAILRIKTFLPFGGKEKWKRGILITFDEKGNYTIKPEVYDIEEKKGRIILKPYSPKSDKETMKLKEKLADTIIERMDSDLRKAIGDEVKKALLEKHLDELKSMAESKGKLQVQRKRGCFWLVDSEGIEFLL